MPVTNIQSLKLRKFEREVKRAWRNDSRGWSYAREVGKEYTELFPSDPRGHFLLGYVHFCCRKESEQDVLLAELSLRKCLELDSSHWEARLYLGFLTYWKFEYSIANDIFSAVKREEYFFLRGKWQMYSMKELSICATLRVGVIGNLEQFQSELSILAYVATGFSEPMEIPLARELFVTCNSLPEARAWLLSSVKLFFDAQRSENVEILSKADDPLSLALRQFAFSK